MNSRFEGIHRTMTPEEAEIRKPGDVNKYTLSDEELAAIREKYPAPVNLKPEKKPITLKNRHGEKVIY